MTMKVTACVGLVTLMILGPADALFAQGHNSLSPAEVAAGWRSRWREEAVTFFEHVPLWSVNRTS